MTIVPFQELLDPIEVPLAVVNRLRGFSTYVPRTRLFFQPYRFSRTALL